MCLAFFCRLNLEGNCIRIVLTGSCCCCCNIPHLNTLIMQLYTDRRIPQGERITGVAIFLYPTTWAHCLQNYRCNQFLDPTTQAAIHCLQDYRCDHFVYPITQAATHGLQDYRCDHFFYPTTQAATHCLQNYRCDHFVYPITQAATLCSGDIHLFLEGGHVKHEACSS